MFLKKAILTGFKSFADKTEFEFGPGITAIVGPNGCGKSNVVDAAKWVLGEQSAKGLRGRQMADMIFSGSGTRKSSGLAQVDLVFDNSSGRLATDQTEVTVSRRLYRSGESEYLLNLQVCRLKDIRELFLDTGIGVGGYCIIEQGKVDILLQANPQERRVVFEEAAGISKYKLRKKEALRKLERTEQNLLRVQDVIDEVSRRLRSVKQQAGKARSYQGYRARLQELRCTYALAEFHRMSEMVAGLEVEAGRLNDGVIAAKSGVASGEAAVSEIDLALIRLEEEIGALDNRLVTVESEITAHQERVAQSRQRTAEHREVLEGTERRLAERKREIEALGLNVSGGETELGKLAEGAAAAGVRIDELAAEDRRIALAQAQGEAHLEDAKAEIIELMRRQAQLNNDLAACQTLGKSLLAQKERAEQRRGELSRELEEKRSQERHLREEEDRLAQQVEALAAELAQVRARSAELHQTLDQHGRELAEARELRSAVASKHEYLSEMERRREGLSEGTRRFLERREACPAEFDYVKGIVADLIETPMEHAPLVELALGEHDRYLVVEDGQRFLSAAAELGAEVGRVSAFCIQRLPPFMDGRDFTVQPGFLTTALDLVRYPAQYEQLVRQLLGKVVIVATVEDALRLAEIVPVGYRYLTQGGELVEPDGSMSAGSPGGRSGLISRKSELRELSAQLSAVQGRIAVLEGRREEMSVEAAELDRVEQELRARLHQHQTERVEIGAHLQGVAESLRRLAGEEPILEAELKVIEGQITDTAARSQECMRRLADLSAEQEELKKRIEGLTGEARRLADERRTLGDWLTEARVEAGRLREQHTASLASLNGLRQRLREATEAAEAAVRETEECRLRIEQAERTAWEAGLRVEELISHREEVQREAMQLRRTRETLRLRLEELGAEIKSHRQQAEELESRLHEAQVELEGLRIRREDLVGRVRDELSIELTERYSGYVHQEQDWAAIENEIAELKQKIDRLGNVNLDAISELEELELRERFLTSQRDDLTESRRQLEGLIEELNQASVERFLNTFEQSRIHFQELFRKLFGGGRANFLLEDPADPLESGIEIVAQPPGKELQSITLLSGGEKTLTAIALLLAIFRSKPSPFAVLDEVDAALDEANNDRFNRIVREFAGQSQFVLITHSKRTMSIADRMYGVTMQEAGVSKRVSVRFEEYAVEESGKGAVAVA